MDHRLLGRSGIRVSPLCLGCMNFGDPTPEADSIAMIHAALDRGINFVDTADVYSRGRSEEVVGAALAGGRRDRVVLATKAHFPTSADINDRGNSRRHLIRAVEASLRRLKTDWIDLYQLHRPSPEIPAEETLRALDDLVRAGKVRCVGTSTFPAWQVVELISVAERYGWVRVASDQPPYHLLDRRIENELVPMAQKYGVGLVTWSPLAMGMLAGRYDRADQAPAGSRVQRLGGIYAERVTDSAIAAARSVGEVARAAGLDPAVLALAWVREQPGITAPILGPRTPDQLETALASLEVRVEEDLRRKLDAIVAPGTAVADFLNNRGVGER